MVTKTEWLSLRLHSETIFNLVSQLDSAEAVLLEAQLALELESELISMRILIQLLRCQTLSLAAEIPRKSLEARS